MLSRYVYSYSFSFTNEIQYVHETPDYIKLFDNSGFNLLILE